MARCLRCKAGNEWIEGNVKDAPLFGPKPAVAEHVTKAAWLLVNEIMHKHAPKWREEQIWHEVTTSMGMTGHKALIADLKKELRSRGKIEYEIEAIEDVLIKHHRAWTCS